MAILTKNGYRPQKGDKVWIKDNVQPNGVVIHVDRGFRIILVKFLETDDIEEFDYDGLEWTDKYGGTWYLSTEPP